MDISGEEIAEGLVDQAVPGHGAQALEPGGRYPEMEVATAVPGAGVAYVQVAFVDNFQEVGVEGCADATLDHRDPVS